MARSTTPHTTRTNGGNGRRDFWTRLEPVETYASPSIDDVSHELEVYDDREQHGTIHATIRRERRQMALTWASVEDMDEFIADLQDAREKLDD